MADLTFTPRAVRVANTHNVLTRTRPLAEAAGIGDLMMMNAAGQWEVHDGTTRAFGVLISITDGRLEGDVGDDGEVLMEGIIAGYTVDPAAVIYASATAGDLSDSNDTAQVIGVGLNDNLLFVRPNL
jgi:hypothetical protein